MFARTGRILLTYLVLYVDVQTLHTLVKRYFFFLSLQSICIDSVLKNIESFQTIYSLSIDGERSNKLTRFPWRNKIYYTY